LRRITLKNEELVAYLLQEACLADDKYNIAKIIAINTMPIAKTIVEGRANKSVKMDGGK